MAEISDLTGNPRTTNTHATKSVAKSWGDICKEVEWEYWNQPKIHLMRAKEINRIRKTKWKGLTNHLANYVIQKYETFIDRGAVLIYERCPILGEIYDMFCPLPF